MPLRLFKRAARVPIPSNFDVFSNFGEVFSDGEYTLNCTEEQASEWLDKRAKLLNGGDRMSYIYEVMWRQPRQELIDFSPK